jgi:hypothetical protein
MTVSSDVNRISYSGNGSTTVFPVNYYFLENSHLQVILITSAGVETIQTLTTNYTVTGAGNEAGGSVTMLVAPPVNVTIVIQRSVPATQETDYLANDPFPAESHERALDKLTMLAQQNEREIDRALKIPLASVATTSTELPIPVGNKLLAWNSNASAITNFDPAAIISIVGQQTSYGDVFTGNGATVNFTLTRSPGSVFNLDVSVNGVTQVPNVDYTLGGTTLTFTSAPPAVASKILARYSEVYQEVDADAQNVRYLPAGTGAQLTNVQAKLRQTVSVMDFGAVGDGVTDDTVAFVAAQTASQNIFVPPGTYLLNGLRIQNGVQIIGSGYENTIFKQAQANTPAINCLSDATTGQLSSLNLKNFKVEGAVGATVAAVLVAAYGIFAVWKSNFDFVASDTFRALEIQAADANNVFRCSFKVTSQDTSNTAVLVNGGTYNSFDLFLTNCDNGKSLNFVGLACFFERSVSDGQQFFAGNQTVINNATVEEWPGTSITGDTYPAAIVSNGFSETFINPMVILTGTSAAKVSFAFRPFDNTTYINPKILAGALANPFMADNAQNFLIMGPGQSTTINKMDTVFTDTNSTTTTLRRVSFTGDCSEWVAGNLPGAGAVIQYLAPTTAFNLTIKNNTSAMVFEPSGTIATCNITLPNIPVDNQVLSFSTTQELTAITIGTSSPSGVNVSLVPTTMAANSQFSIVYRATNNKWYRI